MAKVVIAGIKGLRQIDGIYWLDYYVNGQRVRKRIGTNKQDAVTLLGAKRKEMYEGKHYDMLPKVKKISLKDFSIIFMRDHVQKDCKAPRAFVAQLKHLNDFFGDKLLQHITIDMIKKYQALRLDNGISKETINKEVGCLRNMFNWAVEWHYAVNNPCKDTKINKIFYKKAGRIIKRCLGNDEETSLLQACRLSQSLHLYPIVQMALGTGMRRGEILSLKWRDIDLENGFINIEMENTKDGDSRSVPIRPKLIDILKYEVKKPNTEYVFCHNNGEPLTNFDKAWRTALKIANIKHLRFHDLRHTYASRLVMRGAGIEHVQKLLGHSDSNTTMRYAHLSPQNLQMAVSLLDLGQKPTDTKWTLKQDSEVTENKHFPNSIDSIDNNL